MEQLISSKEAHHMMPSYIARVETLQKNIERANVLIKNAASKNRDNTHLFIREEEEIDDLIDALNSSKEDTNVYDANGILIGQKYTTPQLGTLANILSAYNTKNASLVDFSAIKDTLGESFTFRDMNPSKNNQLSLSIDNITVNEVNDGDEFAKAIVEQFPNALLQALYAK